MHVTMGMRELVLGDDYLGLMREAGDLVDQPVALGQRFEHDGYLLLRGALDAELVGVARRLLVDRLAAGDQLDPTVPADCMRAAPFARGELPDPRHDRATARLLQTILGGRRLESALRAVLGDVPVPLAVTPHADGHGRQVGLHLERASRGECGCWVAMDDVAYPAGPMVVLEGSHRMPALHRALAARDAAAGAPRMVDPVAIVDEHGGRWLTTELRAGDALLVRRGLLHGSLSNVTGRYRLTCEVRFAAAEDPGRLVNAPAHRGIRQARRV